jgi:glucose-1-phosphatase
MLKTIDAIIFDLGGVILNLEYDATQRAFEELMGIDFHALYNQTQQTGIFDAWETGAITADEFRAFIRSQQPDLSLSDAQIDTAWNAMLKDFPPHRIDFLRQIGKQKPIYLLSNTNAIHKTAFDAIYEQTFGQPATHFDTLFQQAHYSHILGRRKPHQETFACLIELHGLKPETTLFIDDSPQHIEGAKQVGLQTIWLDVKRHDVTELLS